MAGFEVVVRPVVFPNIRPQPARSLPPADDPEKGFAVIRGNGAKGLTLSNNWSSSASRSRPTETERRYDVARVYQKEDNGNVNKENFVDIEVVNRLKMQGGAGFAVAEFAPRTSEAYRAHLKEVQLRYYQNIMESSNIEIKKRDQTRKNEKVQAE